MKAQRRQLMNQKSRILVYEVFPYYLFLEFSTKITIIISEYIKQEIWGRNKYQLEKTNLPYLMTLLSESSRYLLKIHTKSSCHTDVWWKLKLQLEIFSSVSSSFRFRNDPLLKEFKRLRHYINHLTRSREFIVLYEESFAIF